MLIILLGIILSVAFITLLERKLMGSMQRRIGPNKVGYLGLIQPLLDGVKLILKENILPIYGNVYLFLLAPFITFYLSLTHWMFIPLSKDLIVSELEGGGILIIILLTELSIFGVLYAGWSANSKYPLMGALRSTAQMISYSINLSLIILTAIFLVSDISLLSYVDFSTEKNYQRFLALLPMTFLFIISALAETNRAPFDLPEAKLLVSLNSTICWELLLKYKYLLVKILQEIQSAGNQIILYKSRILRDYTWNINFIYEDIVQNIYLFLESDSDSKNTRFNYSNYHLLFKYFYKKSGIYGFKCIITQDLYIGSAINLEKRIKEHLKGKKSNILLLRALQKYGLINFEIIIFEIVDTLDLKTLQKLEDAYLSKYKPAYNINILTKAIEKLGYKHTNEAKLKMSLFNKKELHPLWGKKHSDETKLKIKISLAQLGDNNSMFNKTHSFKTRELISKSKQIKVYIYDVKSQKLLFLCNSITQLADTLNVHKSTISRYIKSKKVWKNKYIFQLGK